MELPVIRSVVGPLVEKSEALSEVKGFSLVMGLPKIKNYPESGRD